MGYYIEVDHPRKKAQQLVEKYNAELVIFPEDFNFNSDCALICVVENGPFDAAGIAYDAKERDVFNDPGDWRVKTWLKIPKDIAIKLCPYAKEVLT